MMNVTQHARQLPITLALTLIAILLAIFPASGDLLQWERNPYLASESWRMISGHFVHWSADHAFWDIVVFAVLAAICEQRSRTLLLGFLGASAVVISLGIDVFEPSIQTYRGLSGIDTGLFTLATLGLLQEKWRAGEYGWSLAAGASLLGLGAKTVYEFVTGNTLFVQSRAIGFAPLASVHLVGTAVGLTTFIVGSLRRSHLNQTSRRQFATLE